MPSELEDLRDAIVARLQTMPAFEGVTVLSRKTGDLQNQIEDNLARLGIVATVATAQAGIDRRQSTRVVLDPVAITILIAQDPLLDRSGKTAIACATDAARALKFWHPGFEGAHPLVPSEPGMTEFPIARGKEEQDREEDMVGWLVFFETKLSLAPLS